MRTATKAGIAGVALATAATMTLGIQSASGTDQSSSSAFGFKLGPAPGEPAAKYPEGPTSNGGNLPGELGPLASGGVLTVSAGNDQATAQITNLTLGSGLAQLPRDLRKGLRRISEVCAQLPEEPAEDVDKQLFGQLPVGLQEIINTPGNLRNLCGVIGDGTFAELASIKTLQSECNGNRGTVAVSDARIFGSTTPINDTDSAPKNFSVLPEELEPLIKVTLNRQTQSGENFTVDGLVLEVGGQQAAVLASATCGGPIAHEREPKPAQTNQPKPAPVPTTVERHVPVTG